jgi:hypothetical protein
MQYVSSKRLHRCKDLHGVKTQIIIIIITTTTTIKWYSAQL